MNAQPSDAEIRRKLRERCSETFELAREAGDDAAAARQRARVRAADALDVSGDLPGQRSGMRKWKDRT